MHTLPVGHLIYSGNRIGNTKILYIIYKRSGVNWGFNSPSQSLHKHLNLMKKKKKKKKDSGRRYCNIGKVEQRW